MKVIYTPEDAERQEFTFRPGELMSPEAEALEECGGAAWATFEEYGEKFMAGSLKARRAALWILLRRSDPKLRFSDLVVRVDELNVRYDEDELSRIKETIEADDTLTDAERAEALAAVLEVSESLNPPSVEPGKEVPGDGPTDLPSPQPDTEPSLSS
jgi:hypothetical protein